MALFQTTLRSHFLGMNTGVNILMPTDREQTPDGGFPVLYLLHGMSDDHTSWLRNTRIEQYAARYSLAVVMPDAQLSFYCDMVHGGMYGSYIARELPDFIRRTFPVTAARAGTFVAGLSMGGFGALKLGLGQPGQFAACAGLSAAITPVQNARRGDDPQRHKLVDSVVGDAQTEPPECDLSLLAHKQMQLPAEARTRVYLACGTEDFLYEENRQFRGRLDALGFAYTYDEGPGRHDWDFWDAYIQKALAFFLGE